MVNLLEIWKYLPIFGLKTQPSQEVDRTSKIVFCVVLCIILSAACSWVISTHLTSAPLIPVFAGCLLGAAVSTGVLAILDITRAALLAGVFIAAALVITPVLRKLELPKVAPYTAAGAFFVGFVCSRLVYKES